MTRSLCALLLSLAMPCAAAGDHAAPTAILIVARADLPDSNFKDSIVLVMNNLGPAPGGVIVNRPTRIPVSHLFPDIKGLAQVDDKLYFGGPVHMATVSFLFRADSPPEHALQVLDGVYVSTDAELLRELLRRDKPMEGLRIFFGYSGWGPGQLEAEIARGDWKLAPAKPDVIFERKAEHPWPEKQEADAAHRT